MRKYEFTGETKQVELLFRTVTLHRIKAVAEFGIVKAGDLGGCFLGKIDKFLEKVTATHGNSKYALVYRAAVEVAKLQIDLSLSKPLAVGDKVRIISAEENDVTRNWTSKMEKYLGTVMTIKQVYEDGYRMEEDDSEWFWDTFRIAGKVE